MTDIGKAYVARAKLQQAVGQFANVLVDQVDGEWVLKVFGQCDETVYEGFKVVTVVPAGILDRTSQEAFEAEPREDDTIYPEIGSELNLACTAEDTDEYWGNDDM